MKNNFDKLQIGNKSFNSRLMLGTGKYRTVDQAINSINTYTSYVYLNKFTLSNILQRVVVGCRLHNRLISCYNLKFLNWVFH